LKLFLKILFLLFTIYLLVPYSIGLYAKVQEPNFKNLPFSDYLWIGLVLLFMLALNIKWLYIDRKKNKI